MNTPRKLQKKILYYFIVFHLTYLPLVGCSCQYRIKPQNFQDCVRSTESINERQKCQIHMHTGVTESSLHSQDINVRNRSPTQQLT